MTSAPRVQKQVVFMEAPPNQGASVADLVVADLVHRSPASRIEQLLGFHFSRSAGLSIIYVLLKAIFSCSSIAGLCSLREACRSARS